MALGLSTMLMQGVLAGLVFPFVRLSSSWVKNGLYFGWFLGLFLGSYIALVEPGKYLVPSVLNWALVESIASGIQFTVFGILLGFIHKGNSS